jgi:hypothetical protein
MRIMKWKTTISLMWTAGFSMVGLGSPSELTPVHPNHSNALTTESIHFVGMKDGEECTLDLTVENGAITSFEASGVGSMKAIDIFGNCDGGGVYPCRKKGVLKSGLLGLPFGDSESFASVNWDNTTYSSSSFILKGQSKSSDSTRKIRLAFDGSKFTFKETVSLDSLGVLVAAEQKTECKDMMATKN